MILTENQRQFLLEQIYFLAGSYLDMDLSSFHKSLLLGLTEAESTASDNRGNKDFQHNPLFWSGQVLEPVINQWLSHELEKRKLNPPPIWPQGKKFAVCLTHDVDEVDPYSLLPHLRCLKTSLLAFSQGVERIEGVLKNSATFGFAAANSWRNGTAPLFDPWLELEDKFGFRSTFFFFPDKAGFYHPKDGPIYHYHDRMFSQGVQVSVQEFMRKLVKNGWEVGLHGSFLSFDDPWELQRQKAQVEKCLEAEVVSIRQHCLHFDITKTPRAQSLAGFKFDSTYGSNRLIGFRNGLALPFYHYDLAADRDLPILQIPLHIQDSALLRRDNLDLTPESALNYACQMIDKVEQIGGLITLLWHPRPVDGKFSGYFWVYQELLKYIAHKNAWVAPVQDIGNWWEQRRRGLPSSE